MKAIFITIGIIAIFYVAFSFFALSLNPANWGEAARYFFAFAFVAAFFMVFTFQYLNKNNQ